jgi:hypothetical protein
MTERFTVRQQQVLEALADYHYLVPAQMVRLALSKSPGAMRRTLRRFQFELPGDGGRMVKNSRAAIGAIRAGVDRESGRIARMYYLTRHGAELVAENRQTDPELIFYPRGDRLVLADVPHRKLAIDFRIELDRYAKQHGHTVEFYHQYFRTAGANRGTEGGGAAPETDPHRLSGGPRRTVPEAVLLAGRHLRPPGRNETHPLPHGSLPGRRHRAGDAAACLAHRRP